MKNVLISTIDHVQVAEVVNPILEEAVTQGVIILRDMEGVFARATAKYWRSGVNPADVNGPLGTLLLNTHHTVEHFAALPFEEVPAFMERVRDHKPIKTAGWMANQQLQFIILTGVRSGQCFKMRWGEINWEDRIWECPWQRTKTGKKTRQNHKVPLNAPAYKILENLRDLQKQAGLVLDYVFVRNLPLPGREIYYQLRRKLRQRELANMPLEAHAAGKYLRRGLQVEDIDLHGFRTSFSSWAVDQLSPTCGFDRIDIEMVLDHEIKSVEAGQFRVSISETARLYARDAKRLRQRAHLLEKWGEYCTRPPADVVQLPTRRSA